MPPKKRLRASRMVEESSEIGTIQTITTSLFEEYSSTSMETFESFPSNQLVLSLPDFRNYSDLVLLPDAIFEELFRYPRRSLQSIVKHLMYQCDTPSKDMFTPGLLLILLYLGQPMRIWCKLWPLICFPRDSEAPIDTIHDINSQVICHLKSFSRLDWPPTEDELIHIEREFLSKYGIPAIAGILGIFVFHPGKRSQTVAQVVLDHKCVIRHVYVHPCFVAEDECYPSMPHPTTVLHESGLFDYIDKKNSRNIICGPLYPQRGCLLTPYKMPSTRTEYKFNHHLHKVLESVDMTYSLLLARFPQLNELSFDAIPLETVKSVISAACILHNLAVFYQHVSMYK